jgi:uncharacterized membrane protein
MFQTQIHLFLSHLPIFGLFFGILVLMQGIYKRSNPTKMAAYYIILVSVVFAVIVYLTGATAQKFIGNYERIPTYTILQHKYFGTLTLLSFSLLGLLTLIGLFVTPNNLISKTITVLVFSISIVCFGIAIKTGISGNKIRHIELDTTKPLPPQPTIDEVE